MNSEQGTIVVFRIQLVAPSETFIVAQAAAMRRFTPFFVGWRRTAGLALPDETSWTVDGGGLRGKLRELRFRYMGPTREQLARLRARSPRLVYAHFAPDGYAAMQLAEQLGVPLVTALHGFDVTMSDEAMGATRLGREYVRGRAALQKKGALFVSCSAYVRKRGLEMGYPADRTIVHSIGVDIERFKPPLVRQQGKMVLFVGRLVEKKGCASLLEAMAEVQQHSPAVELVVIGGGPLRAKYEARAAGLRVRCRFLGTQSPSTVREWMARGNRLLRAQRGRRFRRYRGLWHGVHRGSGHGLARGQHPEWRNPGGSEAWRDGFAGDGARPQGAGGGTAGAAGER